MAVDEGDPKSPQYEAPYIKLYSKGTSNGQKITVFLALLGVAYHYRLIDFKTDEQKEPWFIKLNPNGRIPTLTDVDANGKVFPVFETGAILQYLGNKYDKEHKYYYDISQGELYWDQIKWLTFHGASHTPYQGQANHFYKAAKEDIPYAKKRYLDETKRVFGVYEIRLQENNGWLVGDHLNIADIGAFPWIRKSVNLGIDLANEFPLLKKWVDTIEAIPGVQEGLSVA